MGVYIALLRGVNVGGHNKIKMAELRRELAAIGLTQVQTYIQSGNILFTSDDSSSNIRQQVKDCIHHKFGVDAAVVLRTAEEWAQILQDCPYRDQPLAVGETIYVALFSEPPSSAALEQWEGVAPDKDECVVHGREVYLLLRQSIVDSKRAQGLQKLCREVTTRNWNTMQKLGAMASEAED